jgi:hypothetical protein
MIRDFKDMVRFHNYQMNELMELTPFDYQVLKMMIVEEMNKEIEENGQ